MAESFQRKIKSFLELFLLTSTLSHLGILCASSASTPTSVSSQTSIATSTTVTTNITTTSPPRTIFISTASTAETSTAPPSTSTSSTTTTTTATIDNSTVSTTSTTQKTESSTLPIIDNSTTLSTNTATTSTTISKTSTTEIFSTPLTHTTQTTESTTTQITVTSTTPTSDTTQITETSMKLTTETSTSPTTETSKAPTIRTSMTATTETLPTPTTETSTTPTTELSATPITEISMTPTMETSTTTTTETSTTPTATTQSTKSTTTQTTETSTTPRTETSTTSTTETSTTPTTETSTTPPTRTSTTPTTKTSMTARTNTWLTPTTATDISTTLITEISTAPTTTSASTTTTSAILTTDTLTAPITENLRTTTSGTYTVPTQFISTTPTVALPTPPTTGNLTTPTIRNSTTVANCGDPAQPENGHVTYNETTFNATAIFGCNKGYSHSDNNVLRCGENGTWTDALPKCDIVDCGRPSDIDNGSFHLPGNTTYTSIAVYSCNSGYKLNGTSSLRTCLANGMWSSQVGPCVPLECQILSNPTNGAVNSTKLKAVFSCEEGYSLIGWKTVTCLSSGSWSGPSPTCEKTQPENGHVTYNETTFNATAIFGCNKGYSHSDNNVLRCGENGTWTDALPKCDIVDCGRPSDIDNGSFHLPGNTTYTSIAVYSCNSGYKLNGTSSLRTCLANGMWSSQVGPCVPLECQILPNPTNGAVNSTKLKAVFSCEEGYSLIGWKTVTCLSSGSWSGPSPTCEKIAVSVKNCAKEKDPRGTEWKETGPGQTVDNPCEQGFDGIISRNCTKQGVWKPPRYSCVKKEIAVADNLITSIENNATSKEVKSTTITNVLGTLSNSTNSSSTTSTGGHVLFDGEIEKVTSILDKVASISQHIVVTEKQSEDFIGTTSNLLNPENSQSYKSIAENCENQEGKKATGADKVLEVVGKFAEAIANSLNTTNGTRTVKKDNLLMTVSQLKEESDVHFPEEKQSTSSSVKISKDALKGVGSYSGILYRNLSGLLPSKLYDNGNIDDNMFQINAAVMDMQLLPTNTTSPKFEITLNFENFVKGDYNSKCSFWNFNKSSWDTSGCSLAEEKTDSSMTVCICNHTTNFAILMNPSKTPNVESNALDYISIIGCSVSFVCLVITLVMHTVLWRYLKSDRAKLLMNLSIALILSYAIFLAGVDRTENKAVCTTIAVALHYIYLVVFFLMLSEGIEILITVLFVFVVKSRLRWLLGMSWGLPVIIVAVSVGVTRTKGYGTETFCWLSINSGLIWAFVGPALLVILANFVQLVVVLRTMFKVKTLKDKAKTEKVKTGVRCLCVLLPLTGGTWVIGVFYVNESLAWIQYLFAILNSLQGLFIMLFHCIFNSQMRLAVAKRRKKYLASTSFTGSSSKRVTIPRPTKTTGVYSNLYDSLTDDSYDILHSMQGSRLNGYHKNPRDDERRQHIRYWNSDI